MILSARPPHKDRRVVTPHSLRWEMLQAALGNDPHLRASDLELRREGPSWTVATITQLMKDEPSVHWVFLTGSEGFLQIRTWRDYRRLMTLLPFAIVLRTPGDRNRILALAEEEGWPIWEHLGDRTGGGCLLLDLPFDHLGLSSTRIREALREGDQAWAQEQVPHAVWNIIKKERLYGTEAF